MKKEDTKLDIFSFGDDPGDKFYCLVDCRINPEGLDVDRMKLADPRNFDRMLSDMGCIAMLTEQEVNELDRRGELSMENIHTDLFEICKKEGIIS
ncbi:MAG: hypothetical protein WEC12_05575 [Balneolaceae bacterium]